MKKMLIAVLTLHLTATLLLSVTNTTAQVEEVVVSIPDNNLAATIRETLGLPPGAAITSDAMLKLTSLDAPGKGITDLTGLEYATQLERLPLSFTGVSDVSALANLTQLKELNLGTTNVSDISALANLTQLERLSLDVTNVSDVSALANLTQLERLSLYKTGVSDVSALANLTQLEWLGLSFTGVSDVSALANLTQLEWLDLQNCPLNAAAHQLHIPAIQANGTRVRFDPFKSIHLPRVPWLVSLIYFRPSDRPVRSNVDAEIDRLIKKAQRFFADQLELHGFERKTFQFETDAHGNAVVHHVTGKFPNAHYQQNSSWPWVDEIREQIYIPQRNITVRMLDSAPGTSFTGYGGTAIGGGSSGGSVDIDSWDWITLAHELAHACGLQHDWRADANAKRIRTFTDDPMLTSFCAAEWLSVHPAFNPGQPVSTSNITIKMLPPTLASPPNTIRLRFEVTDLDGLHQAQLRIKDFGFSIRYGALINCQRLTGVHDTVEFVTTKLTPQIEWVTLSVIDVRGHVSAQFFPIDVPSLLPPAKVVSIPDPNLAAAVREALELSVSEAITTHAMLALPRLSVPNRGIKDLTGLEHAAGLEWLELRGPAVSDVSPLAALTQLETLYLDGPVVSDVSPLAALTQLEELSLGGPAVSDVSALAHLTQLKTLSLGGPAVSDVSPLAALTQLEGLSLYGPGISDVSALANLTQLKRLKLYQTAVSDVSALANLAQLERLSLYQTGVSDVSALAHLTQLEWLDILYTGVSDVSALANLTQLKGLSLSNTGVSDVSALANLTQLERLSLDVTNVSDISALAHLTQLKTLSLGGTGVSDISALAHLTQLKTLYLDGTAVSDVSALAHLTQLKTLELRGTGVSDVSALAHLTQLKTLYLDGTDVSDVSPLLGLNLPGASWDSIGLGLIGSPLSYASIHTHIPAMEAKGIKVLSGTVAHPALLKNFGDRQEGAGATALPKPFIVEAMDEHGKPMVGKTVQFDILEGGGRLSAKAVKTDARGKAQVTLTLGAAAGINKVKASSEGIQSWVLFTAVGTEAAPQLVADVNGDGVTDLADLAIVAQAMGKPVENPRADVNGDGVVDGEDFAQVAAHLGEGEAAAPSPTGLPARFTHERVEWALNLLHAENTGSPAFRRAIAKLEGFLALLIPDKTLLLANYPNPFNPETWIPYQLANPAEVTVTIYAANGAVVRTLDLGHQRAGSYASQSRAAYWDGRNAQGEPVASGVYFYTLTARDFAATRKMLILK